MEEVYLFDAVRTPRGKGKPARDGKPGGALANIPPHELTTQLINALSQRHGEALLPSIERLTLGCVGQIKAQGGHMALVSRLSSSLADHASVLTLNNYCVSGLSAIADALYRCRSGEPGLMLAGGVESLSHVGFFEDQASFYTDLALSQKLKWAPPIMGAELMATIEGFTKEDLDDLTVQSHHRASAAWESGRFDNAVIPILNKDGSAALSMDEYVLSGPKERVIRYAKPAFGGEAYAHYDAMMLAENASLYKISHVHSIANCPGPADGASLVVIGAEAAGKNAGLTPKARILSFAEVTGDPVLQFQAGFDAMERALDRAGLSLDAIDLIEFMESFAAPPLKFLRNYDVDPERVNVNGGHLAMGHPMGATGAILVTTLLHEMERQDLTTGLAVALAGTGIGGAIVLERV